MPDREFVHVGVGHEQQDFHGVALFFHDAKLRISDSGMAIMPQPDRNGIFFMLDVRVGFIESYGYEGSIDEWHFQHKSSCGCASALGGA